MVPRKYYRPAPANIAIYKHGSQNQKICNQPSSPSSNPGARAPPQIMTTSTIEQQKILYSKQLAAHTIRLWSSVRTVQMMAGYDLKAQQLNEFPTSTLSGGQSSDRDSKKGLD